MCGAELVSLVTAMAVSLAQGRSAAEIQTLSDIFVQLGDTLQTLAGQIERCGCDGLQATSSLPGETKKSQKGS